MASEPIDILDKDGNKTGQTGSFLDIHKNGLFHKTAHVWILNSKKQLLLQRRASSPNNVYSNYLDISVGGHISAGDTSVETAIKEAKEELGIDLKESDLEHIFSLKEHIIVNESYINNEFQDVFLVRMDIDSSEIKFMDGEVDFVKLVSLEEFGLLVNGLNTDGERLVPHQEEYNKLINLLL